MTLKNLRLDCDCPSKKDFYDVRILLETKESFKPEIKGENLTVTATQQIKYLEVEKCVCSDLDKCFYIIPKKQEK